MEIDTATIDRDRERAPRLWTESERPVIRTKFLTKSVMQERTIICDSIVKTQNELERDDRKTRNGVNTTEPVRSEYDDRNRRA